MNLEQYVLSDVLSQHSAMPLEQPSVLQHTCRRLMVVQYEYLSEQFTDSGLGSGVGLSVALGLGFRVGFWVGLSVVS